MKEHWLGFYVLLVHGKLLVQNICWHFLFSVLLAMVHNNPQRSPCWHLIVNTLCVEYHYRPKVFFPFCIKWDVPPPPTSLFSYKIFLILLCALIPVLSLRSFESIKNLVARTFWSYLRPLMVTGQQLYSQTCSCEHVAKQKPANWGQFHSVPYCMSCCCTRDLREEDTSEVWTLCQSLERLHSSGLTVRAGWHLDIAIFLSLRNRHSPTQNQFGTVRSAAEEHLPKNT